MYNAGMVDEVKIMVRGGNGGSGAVSLGERSTSPRVVRTAGMAVKAERVLGK